MMSLVDRSISCFVSIFVVAYICSLMAMNCTVPFVWLSLGVR